VKERKKQIGFPFLFNPHENVVKTGNEMGVVEESEVEK